MNQHTPGPWKNAEWLNLHPQTHAVIHLDFGNAVEVRGVNAEANARLIVAAPELADFVRRFDESINRARRSGLSAARDYSDWATFQFEARALLAKIEGKE